MSASRAACAFARRSSRWRPSSFISSSRRCRSAAAFAWIASTRLNAAACRCSNASTRCRSASTPLCRSAVFAWFVLLIPRSRFAVSCRCRTPIAAAFAVRDSATIFPVASSFFTVSIVVVFV